LWALAPLSRVIHTGSDVPSAVDARRLLGLVAKQKSRLALPLLV
jgi:hypothetical protein